MLVGSDYARVEQTYLVVDNLLAQLRLVFYTDIWPLR